MSSTALAGMIYFFLSRQINKSFGQSSARLACIRAEHLLSDQQVEAGNRLLEMKRTFTRGHFGPWLAKDSGISQGTAHKYMR
ncbi:DUF3102 domain-containing protein, partial [Phyllobacterium zundukense]|uniref:DUF3102 domain-containing protein n=1 Tax=Phyllobacterium zundukense TaxID=1867719 RepID=UPI00105697AC